MTRYIINSNCFFRVLVFASIITLVTSCSKPYNDSFVEIYDSANILSASVEKIIKEAEYYGASIVVKTYTTLPIQNLNDFCNKEFRKVASELNNSVYESYGILVLASSNPNIAIAKFGTQIEEWNHGSPDYGSLGYYQEQYATKNTEQKVMEIITSAVNYYLREDAFVSYLRGEVFGNLFTGVVKPDDSFLYRFIIYPCQWPFIQILKITRSFYLTIIIVSIILFLLGFAIARYVINPKRKILKYKVNQTELNNIKSAFVYYCIVIAIYRVPMFIGAFSIAISFGLNGVEHIQAIVEGMGLSLDVVTKLFSSSLSKSSVSVAMLAAIAHWINTYDSDTLGIEGAPKVAVWFFILSISPLSVTWVMFIYSIIPMLVQKSYIPFWNNTYMDLRVHGVGKLMSLITTFMIPVCFMLAMLVGTYLGSLPAHKFKFDKCGDIIYTQEKKVVQVEESLDDWIQEKTSDKNS